jgi:hypothetical protein
LASIVLIVSGGCGGDDDDPSFALTALPPGSAGEAESDVTGADASGATQTGTTASGDGDGTATASGDGDGTATTSGDGDGTATTSGDGDGTATTSGDGDGTATTSGDGDGTTTATGDGDGTTTTGDGDGTTTGGGCNLGLQWTFEGSADGFTSGMAGGAAASTWQHGQPLNGPQGTNQVWATNLSGNHNVGECSALVSPSFSLATCASATLTVRHWFTFDENSCWPDCGGGVVQVSTNGGLGWTSLTSPGYTTGGLEWLGSACTPPSGEPGWNGASTGWRTDTADLSAWVGNDDVRVRFLLGAKGSPWFANMGWYIDEVSVD